MNVIHRGTFSRYTTNLLLHPHSKLTVILMFDVQLKDVSIPLMLLLQSDSYTLQEDVFMM